MIDATEVFADSVCLANDCDCPRWHPLTPDVWSLNSQCLRNRDARIAAEDVADALRYRLNHMSPLELSAWLGDGYADLYWLACKLRAELVARGASKPVPKPIVALEAAA